MGTYMGNIGHLMQHWTLCELLAAAKKHTTPGLNFIDAHAMAPWATEPQHPDATFTGLQNAVRNNLQGQSVYEEAWHTIRTQKQVEGYPSSAAFVRQLWEGDCYLLLCELRDTTADQIEEWLDVVRQEANCRNPELFRGDWRVRFANGLPGPNNPGWLNDALTLVSFDPHSCSKRRHGPANRPDREILRPQDLELAAGALDGIDSGILIQLSTYSNNGGNSQGTVISSVNSILHGDGFVLAAVVIANDANKKMMSLVYTRNVEWSAGLANLPGRFDGWLEAATRRQAPQ